MVVLPPCSAFTDARESIKNKLVLCKCICYLLLLSLALFLSLCPLLFAECLHTVTYILYYKAYFPQNPHEIVWNDLCPLFDWEIVQVIGFVYKRHSPYFIYMHACSWRPMLPATPLFSRVTGWVATTGKHVPPPPWYGRWRWGDDGSQKRLKINKPWQEG